MRMPRNSAPAPAMLVAGALLIALPTVAPAQQFLFRYRPAAGASLRMQSDDRTVMIPVGVPSVPDSANVETQRRAVASLRLLGRDGGYDLEVRIDSVRGRIKQVEGGLKELPPSPLQGKRAHLVLND